MWIFDLFNLSISSISLMCIAPWVLWLLYFLVMWVQRTHLDNKYKWWEYLYVLPLVIVAYLFDIFVNYTIASIWFRELPLSWKEEKTVSERLTRYYFGDVIWKKLVAQIIGKYLLDRWDPRGKHIGYIAPETK